ncbi:hypothetical protein HDV62DRAFT_238717 [Trichoderma sp. SZMC 28011]
MQLSEPLNHPDKGLRPVRVANCSGAQLDPGWQMKKQAELGQVDFITGDWLAENNLAQEAESMAAGTGEGFKANAWDALQQSIDVIAQKGIRVVINGGGLGAKALAVRCQQLATSKGHQVRVAFVSGDDRLEDVRRWTSQQGKLPLYFHQDVDVQGSTHAWGGPEKNPLLACRAYLGARAIVDGLSNGAQIVICGRVADASPVIAAAWWWHGWASTNYNELAGALVAGHLIECSGYVTGANFSGFHRYPLDRFVDVGFPIAEIDADGTCVITKHRGTNGMVTEDTVRCQLLYEIQGNVYLNSDVKAILDDIEIVAAGEDRVRVSGVVGRPPPPTTKLSIFYKGGFEAEFLTNAGGYATSKKYLLYERQMRYRIAEAGLQDAFDVIDFQVVGKPQDDPQSQLESTTYCRTYVQALTQEPLLAFRKMIQNESMQHFSGRYQPQDSRTGNPKPFYVYYPSLVQQNDLHEAVHFLDASGEVIQTVESSPLAQSEPVEPRVSYDSPPPVSLTSMGPTVSMPLGNLALGRSGDKGPNLNCGLFVHTAEVWDWFRSYMTISTFRGLIGRDWKDSYSIERVEFPKIYAVHFVIYGILGRGVSSSTLLDSRGKGFADYIRAKRVPIPQRFVPYCWEED